jgi:1-acyl-sn-glycerol-3-phosphate acyltransferase
MRYWLGRAYLRLMGWTLEGQKPPLAKYMILAAPHTSNWDVPLMLALSYVLGVRVHWIGKHTLFHFPLGPLMRWLGGVPVDRRARHDAVQQMADAFAARDELCLMITPEGTRGRAEYWKSGFYHIALAAHVPIVLGMLDYRRKVGGLFDMVEATGDVRADMDKIRAFYRNVVGKYPQDFGPIRLRDESPLEARR